MDVQDTAIQILKEAGKPIHAKKIAGKMNEMEFCKNDVYSLDMGESSIEK